MAAGLAVVPDKAGRDHCVVVVKGTFQADAQGALAPAVEQRAPVYADEPYGEPGASSIRYESDFALEKALTDVLVVGKAVASRAGGVARLMVHLEVEGRAKEILVMGERRWVRGVFRLAPSEPEPFTEMPLTYERAFGGRDDSEGPGEAAVEPRNLVGVGFHVHRKASQVEGTALPNLERPGDLIASFRDRPEPIGFGCVGRSWRPRVDHAGTYDQRWQDETCPFLPEDFDVRYYQSAPADQQFPLFRGGELIRCVGMSAEPVVRFQMPSFRVPVRFGFVDREEERQAALDTVILEPHLSLAMLVWRASVPLGKKLNALREIRVGERRASAAPVPRDPRTGKRRFQGLDAAIRWMRETGGGGR